MEFLTLGLFCGALLCCILFGGSILYALVFGLALFWAYGRKKGFGWGQLAHMSLQGVKTAKNILEVFLLIGMLTALWRASGTVPLIICEAVGLIRPHTVLLMAFLLNCAISVLTGTAFGTAATMGVICMTMAVTLQVDPVLAGGAVLSGVFFGDRCSPVSTSALLVGELTGTSVFDNIRRMLPTTIAPFLLSCAIYGGLGFLSAGVGDPPDLWTLFSREFTFHWSMLLPAAAILLLSLLRVRVKMSMAVSIAAGIGVCLAVRGLVPLEVGRLLVFGYQAADPQVASMLNGGGIVSMVQVAVIVCLSSAYAGIFQETGLLDQVKAWIAKLSRRITPYGGVLATSVLGGMVSCNQTLNIMLTYQLCDDLGEEPDRLAIDLEDTAVVVSPLIPWSIACTAPMASSGAPVAGVVAACFLYLLPLCRLLGGLRLQSRGQRAARSA